MRHDLAKKKRIVNRKLIEEAKEAPCIACGVMPAGDAHHVTSVKTGGDDVVNNLIPLCRGHHTEFHVMYWSRFMRAYPSVKIWLELAGRNDIIEKSEERTCNQF